MRYGADGKDGANGINGVNGLDGADGRDGTDGRDGINGRDGANGADGADGADAPIPFIGDNGNWWIGEADTGVKAATTDFIFDDGGNGTRLLAYVGHDEDVVIPAKTTSIGQAAFKDNKNVRTVVVPENVKYMQDYAFYNCRELVKITLPDGISDISDYAFTDCINLSEVIWNPSADFVGINNHAFDGCWNLSSFSFKEGVYYSVRKYAFHESSLSGSLKFYGEAHDYAFTSTGITGLDLILGGRIGESAFKSCWKLGSVSMAFPDKWQYGGYGSDNNGNCHVSIWFGLSAFEGCGNLKTVTLPTAESITVEQWIEGTESRDVTAGVSWYLNDNAFSGCGSLVSINLPSTLHVIGTNAFANCRALTGIALPSDLTELREGAFMICASLSGNVTIPSKIRMIADGAFNGCRSLQSVTIPEGVWQIGVAAFANTAISSIILPSTLNMLGDGVFDSCANLSRVVVLSQWRPTMKDNPSPYGGFFVNCSALTGIYVPASLVDSYKAQNTVVGGFSLGSNYNYWMWYQGKITALSGRVNGDVPYYTNDGILVEPPSPAGSIPNGTTVTVNKTGTIYVSAEGMTGFGFEVTYPIEGYYEVIYNSNTVYVEARYIDLLLN